MNTRGAAAQRAPNGQVDDATLPGCTWLLNGATARTVLEAHHLTPKHMLMYLRAETLPEDVRGRMNNALCNSASVHALYEQLRQVKTYDHMHLQDYLALLHEPGSKQRQADYTRTADFLLERMVECDPLRTREDAQAHLEAMETRVKVKGASRRPFGAER